MHRWIISAALLLTWSAHAAIAAEPEASRRREPPEVSLGLERFTGIYGDASVYDVDEPQVNLIATIPVDGRFAFEALFSRGQRPYGTAERTEGFFGVLIQQRFLRAAASPVQPFLTYGVIAYRSSTHVPAGIGSCNNGGRIESCPYEAFTTHDNEGPFLAAGGGVHYHPSRFFGVRADVQMVTLFGLPVGVRTSASVSIPIGRYRSRK